MRFDKRAVDLLVEAPSRRAPELPQVIGLDAECLGLPAGGLFLFCVRPVFALPFVLC